MLLDPRISKLAANLVNYSCKVANGDNVLVDANGCDYQLVNEIIKNIIACGGKPL